ncbi:putative bifunctional diguanylate cyclase/phosphodiesterase [Cryptosporangium japonicum]|uniref:Cyclic Di-GMP phosphodiesterase RmdA n=1 Tax=Cryptosporangium japonicum TaxID=80872 RepID=A0ABN0UNR8_9ACTN
MDLTLAPEPGSGGDRRRAFAASWARALRPAGTPADELVGAVDHLVAAVSGGSVDPARAAAAGAALVEGGFAEPAALGESLRLLAADFPALMPGSAAAVGELTAAFATGFAAARERELVRKATLAAQSEAQRALRAGESKFRAVFSGPPVGLALGTPDGRLTEVNEGLAALLGLPVDALTGRRLSEFLVAAHRGVLDEAYTRLNADATPLHLECRLARPGGAETWLSIRMSLVVDEGGPRTHTLLVEDVTEQRVLRLTAEHSATHDRLTGLANRELFVERLTAVLRERTGAERIGLCLLDLDGFKVVNDSLGHPVGDQLLAAVGERLDTLSGDALVARLGGDEFGILLTGTSGVADVERLAAEIVRSLAVPFPPADGRLTLPASIGVVEHAASDASAADLMRAAELTMYRAKSEHRGRWAVYDPHRNDQRVARYTLATEMAAALERDEFVVEFQPLVGLSDGAVRGAEALVRWRHRELGLLSPKRFVGLAEETGAIVPIGRRVIELACRQASRWPSVGQEPPYVSVNLAAAQLADPNLVDDVVRVLEETGLEAGRLQLELAAGTVATVNTTPLQRLAALGVRLAVGDVSAGWANLPLLRNFSVDVVKLSGGVVQRLTASDRTPLDDQVLQALLRLAHALGLQVVAEGIESAEQRDRLRSLGCDTGQGWYYAPALGPEEFIRYLPGSPAFAGR